MNHELIRKIIFHSIKACVALLVLLVFASFLQLEQFRKSPQEVQKILKDQDRSLHAWAAGNSQNKNLPEKWPPKMNAEYPDLELINQSGAPFKISDYSGKIIVIEYIDFQSNISQSQSGANIIGVFGAGEVEPDKYSLPFTNILEKNDVKNLDLSPSNVVQLKIIIYGENGQQGSRDDAENWASHFDLTEEEGVIVAVPVKDMRDKESRNVIGGYQLLDRNMRLRVDSSGITPKHNLDLTLVPLFEKLTKN